MSSDIPPWNPLQFIAICTFTCFFSFFNVPTGGLQVVSYFVCLLVIGIPAVFVQLKLGGYLQKGLVGVLATFFPIWKGIGIAAMIDLLIQVATMATLTSHLGTYAFMAIVDQPYTWAQCDLVKHSVRDAEKCVEATGGVSYSDVSDYLRPETLFYKREFLQMSSGIESTDGFPQWRFAELARRADISMMPITLAIVWVLVTLFVGFGPRICGWILFLLGPTALCSLLTCLGYGYHNLNTDHAIDYLKWFYTFKDADANDAEHILNNWIVGFQSLMRTFPMWTVIGCTMGKLCGRSRKVRNLSWVVLVVVFILVSQAPTITMAPYLGNLNAKMDRPKLYFSTEGLEKLMILMPQAFSVLEIPAAYSFVFFLSAFLFCLMFLCVGMLALVDNMMDALRGWIDKQVCSKIAVHLFLTFFTMVVCQGAGVIMTTRAGYYYIQLFLQSLDKLRFLLVILLAFGLLIVYVRQNFGVVERILMGLWFTQSALASAGMWMYGSYQELEKNEGRIKYDPVSYPKRGFFPDNWTLVSWVIAAFPFVGILLGLIHAIFSASKSSSQKCRRLCCGATERVREHSEEEFSPPLLPSEPSAPPYMYSYMDNSSNSHNHHNPHQHHNNPHHPHHNGGGGPGGSGSGSYPLDHYKLDYSPTELEPLNHYGDRSTRI